MIKKKQHQANDCLANCLQSWYDKWLNNSFNCEYCMIKSDYFTKRIDLSFVKEKNKLKVKIWIFQNILKTYPRKNIFLILQKTWNW